ncbi:MAG: MarC family protein [Oxalobacter formigenes]|nr:MarC family protein [Oxalobacter formigenes]
MTGDIFAEIGLVLKKTLTLLALVDPLLAIPLFVAATRNCDMLFRYRYSRQLGMTVAVALLACGLFGLHFLNFMGVSLAAIQIGGGAIMFVVALAMVVAKNASVKYTQDESEDAASGPSIVPLGIPLLAGPAALSYVMATSRIASARDFLSVLFPSLAAGLATWLCFRIASRGGGRLPVSMLKVIERLAGFLLTAVAVEMMASGMKAMFPPLSA